MISIRVQAPQATKQNVLSPRITVVGVGGGGLNGVNNMIATGMDGVEFMVCNTDAQALSTSQAGRKIQLGAAVTGGLGAGAKPEVGRAAAEESLDDLMQYIDGSNMVFVTAGMGGGTGTGAAPVIAKACKEAGILTVGVVTKPFHFEGTMRMKMAEAGIQEMQQYVDTLIVIPNQNLFRIANQKTPIKDAFKMADSVLQMAVRGVTDLMVMPGLVNLDFADIRTTMTEMGKAMMGSGQGSGELRAQMATEAAINNPLLDDVSMKGAKGVIINIAGGHDMTLFEVDEACNRIREEVDPDANIIFGTSIDESLDGALRVTVLATGIETVAEKKARTEAPRIHKLPDLRPSVTGSAIPAAPRAAEAEIQAGSGGRGRVTGGMFIPPQPVEPAQFSGQDRTVSYADIMTGVASPMPPHPADESARMGEESGPVVARVAPVPVQPEPIHAPAPVQETVQSPMMTPEEYAKAYARANPGVASPAAAPRPHRFEPGEMEGALPAGIIPTTAAPHHAHRTGADEPARDSLMTRIIKRAMARAAALTTDTDPAEDMMERRIIAHPLPTRGGQAAQPQLSATPSASRMDLARPAGSPGGQPELDLEIPAFLRRQAN